MSLLYTLGTIAKSAVTGIAVITARPIFGTVGAITAIGAFAAALADKLTDDD